jgi:hypothetical protein
MSRNTKNVSNKSAAPVQKYCKVCQDAGKAETEYRSHFTRESRDPNSKVICPTLLTLECRYCFKNGHTVKYCDVLKRNQQVQKREEARCDKTKTDAVKNEGKKKNVFMCLDMDSDNEDPIPEVKEEFPTLCAPATSYSQLNVVNYAAALAKPAEKQVVKPVEKPVENPVTKQDAKIAPWASETMQSNKSWAAWDSDSEEEEEEEPDSPVYCSYENEEIDEDW